jgi:hypothetical protein
MIGAILWSAVTSRLAGPVATALAGVLAFILVATLAGRAIDEGRITRLEVERDAWRTATGRWQAAREQSEASRLEERRAAEMSAAVADKACAARITAARRSSRVIHTIVQQEVGHDPKGCPLRGLVPAERLRDALAPGD